MNRIKTSFHGTVPVYESGTRFHGEPEVEVFNLDGVPEGFVLVSHYTGWEEGNEFFLVPKGTKFRRIRAGNPHFAPVWEVV